MNSRRFGAGSAQPDGIDRAAPVRLLHDHGQADGENAHGKAEYGEAAREDGHVRPEMFRLWASSRQTRLN